VDKLTHPDLLIPDPRRSIRGGCFVKEAFRYNPDTWDGRVMYSLSKSLDFSLDTPWKDLKERVWKAVLYGIDPKKVVLTSPPEAKVQARRSRRQGGRLQWHCPPDRALVPPLSSAWRGQLEDGGMARQGDGGAHLS
jgi:excinuclease ABC subunit A